MFIKWRALVFAVLVLALAFAMVPTPITSAQDGGGTTYVVQAGDNLYRISLRFNTTIAALVAANNITNPSVIYVGQVLVIPTGGGTSAPAPTQPPSQPDSQPQPSGGTTTYVVVSGDNLSRIAQRFGTTVAAIVAANNIANPSLIYAGQVLVIPVGGSTPAPSGGGSAPSGGGTGTNPPPVTSPGTGGGFELGGQTTGGLGAVGVMQSAGMSWVKTQVRWHRGDGAGGVSGIINDAHANGLRVLLTVVGFSGEMGDYETYTTEFAAYLGQLATLGPDAIEVWNEPNLTREWPAGAISGASYTRMLSKAYNAIKSANGNVMVISAAPAPTGFYGGCSGNGCDDLPFIQQMRAAGAASYMDCIGAHYNEGIISPDQRTGDPRGGHYTRYFFGMLDTYYNAFGGARKVCFTELGYLSPEGLGGLPGPFAWAQNTTAAQHAEWLGRAASLARNSGRVRLMVVWNVDFQGIVGDDPQGGYAIIRSDGSCPACGSLAAAVR